MNHDLQIEALSCQVWLFSGVFGRVKARREQSAKLESSLRRCRKSLEHQAKAKLSDGRVLDVSVDEISTNVFC